MPRIGEAAQAMLHDALDAFVAGDATKAEQVVERDNIVDAYYAQLFPELVAHMMSDPTVVFRSTRMLSIGKYIERIADHATNIGELVVFMVRGLDVRHTGPASNNPGLDSRRGFAAARARQKRVKPKRSRDEPVRAPRQ